MGLPSVADDGLTPWEHRQQHFKNPTRLPGETRSMHRARQRKEKKASPKGGAAPTWKPNPPPP